MGEVSVYYRPIDIAKSLNISTSALRHYESWGIIPIPERSESGYRLYTEVHFAYFRCIRAMYPGFSMQVISKVLNHIQQGEMDEALWIVNKEQADLHHEKVIADQALKLLYHPELMTIDEKKIKDEMTIGEVAELTDVAPSAIRHWEKEGVITPKRNPENGYRMFTKTHLRQLLLIRAMRHTVYGLENMTDVVKSIEHHSLEQAKKMTKEALAGLNYRIQCQVHGIHELYNLCKVTKLL
ncbi:MerR family transcriptional regulator [Evansella halocellulosilytica]